MEELVKLVSQKTGLSEDISRQVVEVVVGYVKQKLPEPIAGQLDAFLSGPAAGDQLGGLAKELGGLFG
jgi:hypothetical protein